MHHIDRASHLLMKACATGTHIKEATLTNRKAGETQNPNGSLGGGVSFKYDLKANRTF